MVPVGWRVIVMSVLGSTLPALSGKESGKPAWVCVGRFGSCRWVVGGDRDVMVPGPVPRGDRGTVCIKLPKMYDMIVCQLGGRGLSSNVSAEKTRLLRSWRYEIPPFYVARRSGVLGCVDAVATRNVRLLRQCGGSVAQLTSAIGYSV